MQISYAPGYAPDSANLSALLKEAEDLVKRSDMAIVVLGEDDKIDGEGHDRSHLDLDDLQMNLIKTLHHTGKPVAVVLSNGRPLTINRVAENIPSIVETWTVRKRGACYCRRLAGKCKSFR